MVIVRFGDARTNAMRSDMYIFSAYTSDCFSTGLQDKRMDIRMRAETRKRFITDSYVIEDILYNLFLYHVSSCINQFSLSYM